MFNMTIILVYSVACHKIYLITDNIFHNGHGRDVHHSIKFSSTKILYSTLVSIIHNKPRWLNTTALMKTGRISIITVSEILQVTVLLQRFHLIKPLSPHHYKIEIEILTKKRLWALILIMENYTFWNILGRKT